MQRLKKSQILNTMKMGSFYRQCFSRKSVCFPPAFILVVFLVLIVITFRNLIEDLRDEEILVEPDIFSPCNITSSRANQFWSAPSVTDYKDHIYSDIQLTFDDPKTYVGPVIKGWEPDKDRNSSLYVRPMENTIRLDPMACQKNLAKNIDLVILQHSAPRNFDVRMANRITWMQYAKRMPEIRIMFVIGIPTMSADDLENIDQNLQKEIETEFTNFGDILQVDSFESYSNNTLKSMHTFKYLLGLDWSRLSESGKSPRFLMRTDDDVYINLPLVKKTILQNKQWFDLKNKSHWPPMLGDMLDQSPVVKIPLQNMKDKYAPKTWYECPTYFYNGQGLYPSYMQGAGYFIPWWAMRCIYQQSLQLPYFFIEDVFIGGFIADRCALPKHHLQGFKMFKPNKPIKDVDLNFDILFHYVDKNYKIKVHRHLTRAYVSLPDFSSR